MTTYYPIALDPFTDIVAVNWPTKAITKLDFVGNRYMVEGIDQELVDVLGVGENAADQRSWRSSVGLDLRRYNEDGTYIATSNKAFLKNKVTEPDNCPDARPPWRQRRLGGPGAMRLDRAASSAGWRA